jgi:hypothetical protein
MEILNAFKSEVKALFSMSFADIPHSRQHSRGAARVKAHDRFAAHKTRPILTPGPYRALRLGTRDVDPPLSGLGRRWVLRE